MLYIPIILGTARVNRQSEKVANFVLQEVRKFGLKSELLDVRDFLVSATDNTQQETITRKLAQKIIPADGLIVVSPEYNHGYPGELKLMLDLLYEEYAKKPIGFCAVSGGQIGGARAVEQLRLVAIELHMVPIREAVYFPDVYKLFENGKIKDTRYYERVKKFLEELSWYAEALKIAREKI